MIVYHSSDHLFTFPDYDMVVRNRTNHTNGELGLWFSTTNSWQVGFGGYCYEFIVVGAALTMQYSDFYKMCMVEDCISYYYNIRNEWLKAGYSHLLIKEDSGKIEMGVVLDFDQIISFSCISKPE